MAVLSVPRELLPLPSLDGESGFLDGSQFLCSRRVKARVTAKFKLERDVNNVVRSLNEVYGRGHFNAEVHKPSLAQQTAVGHILLQFILSCNSSLDSP